MTTFATLLSTFIDLSEVYSSASERARFKQIWDELLNQSGWTREGWDFEVSGLMERLSELGLNDVQSKR